MQQPISINFRCRNSLYQYTLTLLSNNAWNQFPCTRLWGSRYEFIQTTTNTQVMSKILSFYYYLISFCSTAPNKRHQLGGSPSVRVPGPQGPLHRGTPNRATFSGAPRRPMAYNGPAGSVGAQDTSTMRGGPHNNSIFSKFASRFSRR